MNALLNFQESINFALQHLAYGSLKYIWIVLSLLANPVIFILVFTIIYWNIDKKEGARFGYNAIFALLFVNTLKSIFSIPRPFEYSTRIDNLDLKGSASGTSFPSGHSALASAMYSSLYLSFPSVFKLVMLIVLPIFVALSRLALGVHFLFDVLIGLGIGYGITFIFYRLFLKMDNGLKNNLSLTVVFSSVSFVASLVLNILISASVLSLSRFGDLASMLSLFGGFVFGRFFEHRFTEFIVRARRAKKILRGILGLLPCILLFLICKNFTLAISSTVLYFFISIWCTFLYPFIGIHTNLFNKEYEWN